MDQEHYLIFLSFKNLSFPANTNAINMDQLGICAQKIKIHKKKSTYKYSITKPGLDSFYS